MARTTTSSIPSTQTAQIVPPLNIPLLSLQKAAVPPFPTDQTRTGPSSPNEQFDVMSRTNPALCKGPESVPTQLPSLSLLSPNASDNAVPKKTKKDKSHEGRWTAAEHRRLLEALGKFGNQWKKVCEYIGTRNPCQARSHAQKHFAKIKARAIRKMKAAEPKARKIFAVTREYLNRTVAPARLLEVPDNVSRRARIRNCMEEMGESLQAVNNAVPVPVPQASTPLPSLSLCSASRCPNIEQPQQMLFVPAQTAYTRLNNCYLMPSEVRHASSMRVQPYFCY